MKLNNKEKSRLAILLANGVEQDEALAAELHALLPDELPPELTALVEANQFIPITDKQVAGRARWEEDCDAHRIECARCRQLGLPTPEIPDIYAPEYN